MTSKTIILGLGTNLGNRIGFLLQALNELLRGPQPLLSNVRSSEVFESSALLLPDSPPEWNIPFYNIAVCGDTKCSPEDLLACIKQIERDIGRENRGRWAPREIDIDILVYGKEIISEEYLKIPHVSLLERPFALWPLAALQPNYEFKVSSSEGAHQLTKRWGYNRTTIPCNTWRAPYKVQNEYRKLVSYLSVPIVHGPLPRTEIVGIINITPDSFSDGGIVLDEDSARKRVRDFYEEGATIIDIGAESTRPGSKAITPEEEWRRLAPVLEAIKSEFSKESFPPLISVDTRHVSVADKALSFGINWLNDVTGFVDPEMIVIAAESEVDIVVMHSLGIPPSREEVLDTRRSVVEQILEWGYKKIEELEKVGIKKERIIIDPGIGFGKRAEQSFEIIVSAERLLELGVRVLIGHSRKSFLSLFTDKVAQDRDGETAVISGFLAKKGMHYLRVHNVGVNQKVIGHI